MKDNKKNVIDYIWMFFTSMKVAVFFIILLAIVSIAGTLIPQSEQTDMYQNIYSPFWYHIIIASGFNNLYNSLLYRILLAIIGINITICSIEHTANKIKGKKTVMPLDFYKNFTNLSISSAEACDKILKYLCRDGFYVKQEKDNDGNVHIYGEKGYLKQWGPFIIHISILVIFAGAIYGGITGYKDYVTLLEVGQQNVYRAEKENFQVRLKNFHLDLYENHRIKQYFSDLEVLEGNRKILEKTISVNDPLEYKGLVFYQADWGMAALEFSVISPDGIKEDYFIPLDERGNPVYGSNFFILPNDWIVKSGYFYPDMFIDGNTVKSRSYFPVNPAVTLQICREFMDKHKEPSWHELGLFEKGISSDFEGYKFTFNRVIEYTGLQIKKDPGIPVVYAGCFLMMAGMIITFYTSRRIIRILFKHSDKAFYAGFSGKEEEYNKIFLDNMKKYLTEL
ncbi:MAG: cytochrome c biogenesis protein ResB [Candidatus Eremiobacterota bacterium]